MPTNGQKKVETVKKSNKMHYSSWVTHDNIKGETDTERKAIELERSRIVFLLLLFKMPLGAKVEPFDRPVESSSLPF